MGQDRLVEIYCEPVTVRGGWSPTDTFLAGTQEFIKETAECLTNMGYSAIVLYDGPSMELNGVYYLPNGYLTGQSIVIGINTKPPILGNKKTIYWTNQYGDTAINAGWADQIVVISEFHKKRMGDTRVPITVVPHACWPDKLKPEKKVAGRCLFSSAPERGLDFIESIFPDVKKETGAELVSTYHEKIPESMVDEFYRTSQFWLHPGRGVELFCISGYKAQAAGCIPVYVPNMALAETIKYGVRTTETRFKDDLITAIKTPPPIPEFNAKTWLDVTKELEKLF